MNSKVDIASDEAALWLIRQEEPSWSAEQQAAFDRWLHESTLHRVAYLRQQAGWRAADRIASLGLGMPDLAQAAPISQGRRWAGWAIAASLAACMTVGTLGWLRYGPAPSEQIAAQEYRTRIGGREIVPLPDGSKVDLNTATALRAVVSATKRELWLDRGEAYFEVSHRDNLPFVVHAGSRSVTVLGTKFLVRRDGPKMVVAVVEGRVRVDDGADGDKTRSATISAGEMVIARGTSTFMAMRAEDTIEKSLAWRSGALVLTDMSLAQATSEFNRYHYKPIVTADAATANIRIDGAFQVANVDGFLRLLHDAYGLKVVEEPHRIKISRP